MPSPTLSDLSVCCSHNVDCALSSTKIGSYSCHNVLSRWQVHGYIRLVPNPQIFSGHQSTSFHYEQIMITGVDCRIIVWDISTAGQVCELKGHSDTVYQLAYSRDGTILASGGLDKCVKLWDTSCFEENGVAMNPQHW